MAEQEKMLRILEAKLRFLRRPENISLPGNLFFMPHALLPGVSDTVIDRVFLNTCTPIELTCWRVFPWRHERATMIPLP